MKFIPLMQHDSYLYAWVVGTEAERDLLLGLGLIMGVSLSVFVIPLYEHREVRLTDLIPNGLYKVFLYDPLEVATNLL